MSKLTVRELQSLTADNRGQKLIDDGNLRGTVRVSKQGEVSVFFEWRYRYGGSKKSIACGTWPKVSLAAIRKERDEARKVFDGGQDPALARKVARVEKAAQQKTQLAEIEEQMARATVRDLFDRWVSLELAKRKESSRAEVVRAFTKDVLPMIGKLYAEDVTKSHVMRVLDAILARNAPRLANRTLSDLRQMFGFGYVRGIVQNDPTHRIRKADVGGKETERDRVLEESEIRELARKLPDANLQKPSELAVWIMLSTGCRVGDLMKAQWSEIDFDAGTWTFQPEKDKTHIQRTHTVFLSDFAVEQFRQLWAYSGVSRWLYPNTSDSGPVCKKSITRQLGDRQTEHTLSKRTELTGALKLTGGRWTPHDLRRTATTMMVELGVSSDVAQRCTYHLEQDRIKRTYNRAQQREEQARAWAALGTRLDLLVNSDDTNVAMLRRRA